MRVITLTQPWASLMAIGAKRVETRSWRPFGIKAGERIAIHAAKGWTELDRETCTEEPFRSALRKGWREGYLSYLPNPDARNLPRGQVLAIARFVKAIPGDAPEIDVLSEQERAFGFYGPGRWAWFLEDVRAIEPIPASGKLGLWNWGPPDTLTYLELVPPPPKAKPEPMPPVTRFYVDELIDYGVRIGKAGPYWCHLTTDGTAEELHAFAASLGLMRGYASDRTQPSAHHLHYDLTPSKRTLALRKGAIDASTLPPDERLAIIRRSPKQGPAAAAMREAVTAQPEPEPAAAGPRTLWDEVG